MVDRLVRRGVGRPGKGRQAGLGDGRRVAEGPVGHDAGRATHFHSRRQDCAQAAGALVAARVDDQHVVRADPLHGDALRIGQIINRAGPVEVLARRNVAQGERLAHHPLARSQWPNARHKRIVQPAPGQLFGQDGSTGKQDGNAVGNYRH